MDFKPAIKTLCWLIVLLAMLSIGIVSSMGAINYGGPFVAAGVANLCCWAFVLGWLILKLIKNGTL